MTRYARLQAPGALVHVIARFVNKEHRLAGAQEREAFLQRLPRALAQVDWTLHAYALMSNHVHLALLAGDEPLWRWSMSLHISIAKWLNRTQGRFGPVFAERATTLVMSPERMAVLVAYLHNNPVRAGVCDRAAASLSTWTSHQAWLGREAAPPWLAVAEGLRLAGFAETPEGRRAFDDFVQERAGDKQAQVLSGGRLCEVRRRSREATALPVEIASPMMEHDVGEPLRHALRYSGALPTLPRWEGALAELLSSVAERSGITVDELCSRSHRPHIVRARRLALLTGVQLLRRRTVEVAGALAISGPAASALLRDTQPLQPLAREIAAELRRQSFLLS